MTAEQQANALRAQVIDTQRKSHVAALEIEDFTERYRACEDTREQVTLCRQWLHTYAGLLRDERHV